MVVMGEDLTHLDAEGRVQMVDVGDKPPMRRVASAEAFFCAASATLDRLTAGELPKGEALATARVAGILAAKRTDGLIPLCHALPMDAVNVAFERAEPERLRITAEARTTARTGVEMEALTAVSIAALTLWDMTKAIDKDLRIEGIRLLGEDQAAGLTGPRGVLSRLPSWPPRRPIGSSAPARPPARNGRCPCSTDRTRS